MDARVSDAMSGDAKRHGNPTDGGLVPSNDTLKARIENTAKMTIEVLTLACAGDCADVEAVASGGNPPYTYSWDDGSSDNKRHVCLDASQTLTVTATDTENGVGEFSYAAQTSSAKLSAIVLQCGDAGTPSTGSCHVAESSPPCTLEGGGSLPEEQSVSLMDIPHYFGGGASLPAGRYRLRYVDGCVTYGDAAQYGWTVHFLKAAGNGCSLVDADAKPIMFTPGTEGLSVPSAFGSYAECVAANCNEPPLDFDFTGGKLGVMRNGGTAFAEFDDLDGTSVGGRAATFRLTRLDACP